MKRRQFLAATGVASFTALAGCGGGGTGTATVGSENVAATITLTNDQSFEPTVVSIEPGEAVEWVNETDDERDVRGNTNLDDSAQWGAELTVEPGGTVRYQFDGEGLYTFHDHLRTWSLMCGAVAVGVDPIDRCDLPCVQNSIGNDCGPAGGDGGSNGTDGSGTEGPPTTTLPSWLRDSTPTPGDSNDTDTPS